MFFKKIYTYLKNLYLQRKQRRQRKKLLKKIREADMYIYD